MKDDLPVIIAILLVLFLAYIVGHNDGYELSQERCELRESLKND